MVPVPDGPVTPATARKLVELFEESYEAVYGKGAGFRFAGIELTTFRVVAVGRTRKPSIRKPSAVAAPKPGTRRIFEPTTLHWTDAASSSGWTCRPDFASAARRSSSIRKPRSMSGPAKPRGSTTPAIFPSI